MNFVINETLNKKNKMKTGFEKDTSRIHYRRFHNIYIYITERCQLRCGHCYMGDRLDRGLSMTYEMATKIMNYCRWLGGEYITFLGGEPTLHLDLPRLVEYALEVGYSQVMINSNGLMGSTLVHIPPEKLHYISFSLDGATPQTHDKIRGKGSFEKTLESVKKALEDGFSLRIICSISQMNVHEAPKMLSLVDELGVSMLNFHVFSEEGKGMEKSAWSLTPEEWIDFYENLENIKYKYRTSIWYPPTYARPERLQKYVKEGYRGCVGCYLDRLSIFPDERCYVCSVLFDLPIHFGMLTNKGLILNKEANEFDLFSTAIYNADEPWLSGCPADGILEKQGKKKMSEDLISVCRLWKSQI